MTTEPQAPAANPAEGAVIPAIPAALTVQVTQEIPVSRIVDMVIGAIEGGSGYWMNGFDRVSLGKCPVPLPERPWYANACLYTDELVILVADHDEASEGKTRTTLTAADWRRGLQTLATKYPRHLADLIAENDDATTADSFMQCVVFDDIVFG